MALVFTAYATGFAGNNYLYFAEKAISSREFEKAEKHISTAIGLGCSRWKAAFYRARIARLLGDFLVFRRQLSLAKDYGGEPDRIQLESNLYQVQLGMLETLEPYIVDRLANSDRDFPEICDAYANGLSHVARLETATQILEAWEKDDPKSPVPPYRIGRIHEYSQRLSEAKASYTRSLENSPNFAHSRYSLGRLLLDENEAEQAEAILTPGLNSPAKLAIETSIALCRLKKGEIDSARQLLEQVLRSPPDEISKSYHRVGDLAERLIPASELGKLEANEGNFDQALHWLDAALLHNPRDVTAMYSRGLALRGLGRESEANIAFEQVDLAKSAMQQVNVLRNRIHRDTSDIDSMVQLGQLLYEYESEVSGMFWIRSALEKDPIHPRANELLNKYQPTSR